MTEKRQTRGLRTNQERILCLKAYISSKESAWFWLSLAFIFAFFIFSFITSENVLVLFVKRVTALTFAFLIPGYVITKTIYPKKNELDVIEQFAFSVAFSITFIMFISYILNYVWAITPFSLAITPFLFASIFAFTAILRSFHIYGQKSDSKNIEKRSNFKKEVLPLVLISAVFFMIKSYEPLTSARVGWTDPYFWSYTILRIISEGHAYSNIYPFNNGYPPGFAFLTTFLTLFLDIRPYDTIRYTHISSFLTIIPAYLFARHVFKSPRIAFLSVAFMLSTRWLFMRTSISNPETMSHFLVILFLLMFLKAVEKPSTKSCLVASLLLTSVVLEYHMPLQFLVPFIPLIFTFLYIKHLKWKTGFNLRGTLKTASLIGIPAALFSGALWYFWNVTRILRIPQRISNPEVGQLTFYDIFLNREAFVDFVYHVRHIGLFEAIFSLVGLTLIILNINHRKETRYQFLVIYVITILLLIQSNYLGVKSIHVWYMFAWLAFPASMLAGYGLFTSIRLIHVQLKKLPLPSINFPHSKSILLVLGVILVLLANFNAFNYHWYEHNESKVYPFEYKKRILTNPRVYLKLQDSVDKYGYQSSFLYKEWGMYGFYYPFPISKFEYRAFKAARDITPPGAVIFLWGCKIQYAKAINERRSMSLERYGIDTNDNSTKILKSIPAFKGEKFIVVGLPKIYFFGTCPNFSQNARETMAKDPNFKLVYENPRIKIYKLEVKNYVVVFDKLGGFRENFTSLLYWGNNLNEKNTLRAKKDIATYRSKTDNQPIDVVFSGSVDTGIYPYFETRMRVVRGKISIGVYDSTGKAHMFLNNFTTDGEWVTYKFNLYDWLVRNGYEDTVYGIIITDTLDGGKSFRSQIDWISIHNHIFWDVFNDESRIAGKVNVTIGGGGAALSKAAAELLSNNGFEDSFKGWRPHAKWSIDNEESHSGNKSAVLYGTVDPAHDASAYLNTKVYRRILKPNTSYRFSAWIKGNVTDAVKGPVRQFGSADPWSRWVPFTRDNKEYSNWTYSEGIITTPDDINGNFLIRIYGGGNPAVWIDDVSLREDTHESSGTLTSTTVTTKNPIVSVTPTWTSTEPDGKNITIEISVDNGTTWTGAKNGVPINYTASDSNKHLLYRAYLQTDDIRKSPVLHDITLTYEEQPQQTDLAKIR